MISNLLDLPYGEPLPPEYTGVVQRPSGTLSYFLKGIYHRTEGAAIVAGTYNKCWCLFNYIIHDSDSILLVL